MAAHAKLGASSAARWISCPASVPLSEYFESGETSPHAELGSAAHALGEHCLLTGDSPFEFIGEPVPDEEYRHFTVDVEMADAVQVYVGHIRKRHDHYGPFDPDQVESRVRLDAAGPDFAGMFGTADFIFVGEGELYVDDYKHGSGVAVEVQDNFQAKYYAAGALLEVLEVEDIRNRDVTDNIKVFTTIIQPRKPHPDGPVRTAEYTATEILDWLYDEVAPAVIRAREAVDLAGNAIDEYDAADMLAAAGMFGPSESACRWCDFKALCRANAERVTQSALLDFDTDGTIAPTRKPAMLTPDQVAQVLDNKKQVEKYLSDVEAYAKVSAEKGVDVTNGRYGLGTGRASRNWKDPAEAERTLLGLGVPEDDVFKRTLITPAQAEKKVDKQYKELLTGLIETQEGKPKLVKVSTDPDAKPRDAMDDFNDS